MARECFEAAFTSYEKTDTNARQILTQRKFKEKLANGERIWQKGDGMITQARCIKLEYGEGVLKIWGWVETIPGVEQSLKGFLGAAGKGQVLEAIAEIRQMAV